VWTERKVYLIFRDICRLISQIRFFGCTR